MTSKDDINLPSWVWKAAIGALQAVMLASIGATSSWAWSAESRITVLEAKVSQLESDLDDQDGYSQAVVRHETDIQVLKTKLEYISAGVDEVKALLSKG